MDQMDIVSEQSESPGSKRTRLSQKIRYCRGRVRSSLPAGSERSSQGRNPWGGDPRAHTSIDRFYDDRSERDNLFGEAKQTLP